MGMGDTSITPSEQQQAIWDVIDIGPKPSAMGFAAFNKSARDEMERRLDGVYGCNVMTMHGLGFAAVKKAAKSAGGYSRLSKWKTRDILCEHYDVDYKVMMRNKGQVVNSVDRMVQLSKYAALVIPDDKFLDTTSGHYGVEVNGQKDEIYDLTRRVLVGSKEDINNVNFDDMIWLPVVRNLPTEQFDLLMVDEGQDLNHCQQQLALKSGERIVLVGDENQAIYGFAGADTESMNTMWNALQTHGGMYTYEGEEVNTRCRTLPLTITRRCSHAVVEEAKLIVPEFEAHEDNLTGSVSTVDEKEFFTSVEPNDMALCRTNAPLVRNAFILLGQGVPAEIIGRDIKGNLITLIKMLKPSHADDLVSKLHEYEDREIRRIKKNPRHSEAAILAVEDKCECLRIFARFADSISDVFTAIERVFTSGDGKRGTVRLSSIHRAKGLESTNVFILHPELLPHPMAKSEWEVKQERNLKYVAITRAIENLYWAREEG